MTTFGTILKEERLKRNLSQAKLGEMLGVSQTAIASYERDEKTPRPTRLKQISSLFNLSPNELLGHTTQAPEIKKVHGVIRVPVIGKIAASESIGSFADIIEYNYIPDNGKYHEGEVFILHVTEDTMEGRSRIQKGDRVLVQRQDEIEPGEIAVVNIRGGDATLTRINYTNSGDIILSPDNANYEPILVTRDEVRVCGKVVQVYFDPM